MGDRCRQSRRGGWTRVFGAVGILVLVAAPFAMVEGQGPADGSASLADPLQVRVWIGRGESPVLERGDRARLYYRASDDAYVAVFHINTDGIVRLVHPRIPDQDHYVRGRRDYRLLFPRSSYWFVDDDPGVGYFFAVASPRPFDFSSFRYSYQAGGWDLSEVGRRVYEDPYEAMDEYVARLIPGWRDALYALDFVEYHVGSRHEYPRFLCYDCHGFRPYQSWNPYHYACRSFRLVISTDPYFYPSYRYRGARVVYTRPSVARETRFSFKERVEGEPWTPLYRRSSGGEAPGLEGAERRRPPDGVPADGGARDLRGGAAAQEGGERARRRGGAEAPSAGRVDEGDAGVLRRGEEGAPPLELSPGRRSREGAVPSRPVLRRRTEPGARPSDAASPSGGDPRTPAQVRPPSSEGSRDRPSDALERGRRGGEPPPRSRDRAPLGPSPRPSPPTTREPGPSRREPPAVRPDRGAPGSDVRPGRGTAEPSPGSGDRGRGSGEVSRPIRPRPSTGRPAPSVRRRPTPPDRSSSVRPDRPGDGSAASPPGRDRRRRGAASGSGEDRGGRRPPQDA